MLANYWNNDIKSEIPDRESQYSRKAAITYSGTTPTLKVGGSYKIFTAAFSNMDASVREWLISNEHGDIADDTKDYVIEYDGDNLKLKATSNYNLIGTVLIVQVVGTDDSTAEMRIEVIG